MIAPSPRTDTATCHTLRDAPVRRPVLVVDIRADVRVAKRLADLGLTPGAVVRVVHATRTARVVAVRSSRVALGLALAAQVDVARDVPTKEST